MISRTLRALATTAALALAATACGGDDDGGGGAGGGGDDVAEAADTPIGRALTAQFLEDDEETVVQTEEQARCLSGRIVNDIGEDRLTEAGVTAEDVGDVTDYDFRPEEIDTIVDAMFGCIDIRASFIESFEQDFGADGAECVANELDQDFVKELMRSEFTGGSEEPTPEFIQAFLDIAAKCDLPLT